MLLSLLEVVAGFRRGSSQASGLYPNPLSDAYPLFFSLITVLIGGKHGTGFDAA